MGRRKEAEAGEAIPVSGRTSVSVEEKLEPPGVQDTVGVIQPQGSRWGWTGWSFGATLWELDPLQGHAPRQSPPAPEKASDKNTKSCSFPAGNSRLTFSEVHIISLMRQLMIHLQTLQ